MGVTDFAPICESEPVMDAVCTAVAGSACSRVLDAGFDREGRSSYVCYVDDIFYRETKTFCQLQRHNIIHRKCR